MAVRPTCRRPTRSSTGPRPEIDNGYNPAFYWNQPHDEDSDEADADYSYGARYSNYPYYPAYPSYTRTYPAYAYNTAAGLGYAQATGGDYDNDGTDYDAGYYDRPYRARHERHSTMEQNDRDHVRATMDRDMPAYERHDADRDTHPVSAGYNGHDRHMFDGDHRAAKPADNQRPCREPGRRTTAPTRIERPPPLAAAWG